MRTFTAVIERDQETGLPVGYVPGWRRLCITARTDNPRGLMTKYTT